CSTTPPVTIAPSHSRTYRSLSFASSAIRTLSAGGKYAIASKRPVRWPIEVISATAAEFRTPISFSANASAFAGSILVASILVTFGRGCGGPVLPRRPAKRRAALGSTDSIPNAAPNGQLFRSGSLFRHAISPGRENQLLSWPEDMRIRVLLDRSRLFGF